MSIGSTMFARQFAFRALAPPCPKTLLSPGSCSANPTWRYFSSSVVRPKAGKVNQPQKQILYQKPTSQPKSGSQLEDTLKFAGRRPTGFARLERKVAKEGELVLFTAPPQGSYVFGAYGIAFFCFAYSIYNSNAVFRDPVLEFPSWQKKLAGGICVVMSAMGAVFLAKTGRLVRSVKAIDLNDRTHLRFTVRNIVPFLKPKQFDVLPGQIAFTRRLVMSPDAARRRQTASEPEVSDKEARKTSTILKAPAKKISQLVYTLFRSVRQIFTQEDFILLEVQGQRGVFRMDSAGYVSPEFLVIGNPLAVKR
ncbi:hypothetical protein BJY04DRAFT_185941 [Aspergillus karnatakaensis]|uniref:uncharacterized protein n=1 Tax=Aspergillus karnatakaensis TaxID=1810916 RepID=UPI003CCD9860